MRPVRGVAGQRRPAARHTLEVLTGLLSRSRGTRRPRIATTCTIGAARPPEVHRAQPVGPRARLALKLAEQVADRVGRSGRRDRLRPVGLRQEGTKSRAAVAATAVVRPGRQGPRTARWASTWPTSPERNACDRQCAPLPPQGMDQGWGGAQAAGVPRRRSGSGRATNWRWRYATSTARCCHTPAWWATTRWAALRFPPEIEGPGANAFYLLAVPSRTWVRDTSERRRRSQASRGPAPLEPLPCGWIVGREATGGHGLDDDRGPRRREGPAGRRGRRKRRPEGADADQRHGAGGARGHHPRAAARWDVQA